jgi:hypothetical protein
MTGFGLGAFFQAQPITLSTIVGEGEIVLEGSAELGPAAPYVLGAGVAIQVAADLCE